MTAFLDNFYTVTPEIVLLCTACLAILAELFFSKKGKNSTLYVALVGIAIAAVCVLSLLNNFKTLALNGLFVSDDLAQLMNLFILISVFLFCIYSKDYIKARNISVGDYYILALFSTLGMMVLVNAHSLITLYLGLELLSLPLYAMAAIRRTNSDAAEAAMKYFVMGAIASALLLYGFSLLYGATGKLNLLDIANTIAAKESNMDLLLSFAFVFIIAGIGFKLAAVPFHMWAPDVYQGAPTSVALLISSAPKIAALAMLLRILTFSMPEGVVSWQQVLLVMSLLSVIIGNLLAVVQNNLKRLFAYSAIAHSGYALFGLVAGTPGGYAASLYYILIYALMTAAAFGLLVLLSPHNIEIETIEDIKGLNKRHPWLAFLMLITLFSMAGVPPTVGFFTKLLVLKALVDVHLTWVAVVGLIFAVVGAYYYIRIIKAMYFEEPQEGVAVAALSTSSQLFYSLNCLSLLLLGIFPSVLINACVQAFAS